MSNTNLGIMLKTDDQINLAAVKLKSKLDVVKNSSHVLHQLFKSKPCTEITFDEIESTLIQVSPSNINYIDDLKQSIENKTRVNPYQRHSYVAELLNVWAYVNIPDLKFIPSTFAHSTINVLKFLPPEKFDDYVHLCIQYIHTEFFICSLLSTYPAYNNKFLKIRDCGFTSRTIYVYKERPDEVIIGCFRGSFAEAISRITEKYKYYNKYRNRYIKKVNVLKKLSRKYVKETL